MNTNSRFRLPLLLLGVLSLSIIAATAALFGFSTPRPLPSPEWIWCEGTADEGDRCTLSLRFTAHSEIARADLRVAASGAARVLLDGNPVGTTGTNGEATTVSLAKLAAGGHELRIEANHSTGTPGVCAIAELPRGTGDRDRLVTDAAWECSAAAGDAPAMARVIAPYSGGPRPSPFGGIATTAHEPKGERFWTVLALLLASMAVACLAGPMLRPPGGARDTAAVTGLAIIFPSILYGSASSVITALAASSIGTGALVALHIGSTTVFVLVLVAWKTGSEHVDRDQAAHRAELSSYDAACDAMELLRLDLDSASPELRAALQAPVRELSESVANASTGNGIPELDQSISGGIDSLRAAVRAGGGEPEAAAIVARVRALVAHVREREIRMRALRRA